MKNPLMLFTGAALVTLAALAGLNMTVWRGGLSDSEKPAEAASQATDAATPPAEQKPAEGAAGSATPEKPADEAGKTPEKSTEVAAIPAPEPPKGETPAKPELDTVRVESDGQAIVAGRAEPGAEVSLKLGEQVIGKGLANAEGAWVVVPDQPLPKGPSEITVEQKMGDAAPVAAEQSIAVAVPVKPGEQAMVALTAPGTATKVLQAGGNQEQASLTEAAPEPQAGQPATAEKAVEPGSETQPAPETNVAKVEVPDAVSPSAVTTPSAEPAPAKAGENVPLGLAAVDYNDKGDIIFSGRAKPGSAVRLYVDNSAVGDAMVDVGGNWTFAGKDIIAPGTHDLRLDQIDQGGKVIARVELPFVRENAEAIAALNAPPAPAAEKTGEATAAQPTAEAPAQPAAEAPAQPTAEASPQPTSEAPPQPAAEAPAQPTAQQPAPAPPEPPAQQTAEQPQTAAAPQASPQPEKTAEQPQAGVPEPSKIAAAEPQQTSEVQKTEPTAPAPASDQPATGEKKPEVASAAPTEQATKTAGAEKPRMGKVIIQPGNNLWKLSRVIYGRGKNYTVIYRANRDQIRSPGRIYPGQIFAIPGALPPEKIDPKRKEPLTSAEGGAVIE